MQFIQLHKQDNVAVALEALSAGHLVHGGWAQNPIVLTSDIAAGHKFALSEIKPGDAVVKYGAPIGVATAAIGQGDHVHLHNLSTNLGGISTYTFSPQAKDVSALDGTTLDDTALAGSSPLYFEGYRRAPSGKVGTRNEIWVLSTVGCVARLSERIAQKANQAFAGLCDGVLAFTHPFGCSQTGGDHEYTQSITLGLMQHPNAGAVLLVGLGCENNQISHLLARLPKERLARVAYFNCQQVENELDAGLEKVAELIELVRQDRRESCALSDLVIGMKCGGSDGFSGLSANPLVGRIADRVAAAKGTVLLTEVPEMFGAEHILMNRARNAVVFEQIVSLINHFKQYFINHQQNIYENPSPGNKAGGITTLEEKSMGAIQKGGTATVMGVLQYAEPVLKGGLHLLQAPGNDAVSSTALVASGATLILFTTGRGTPLGFPAPTVKISSNSALAKNKPQWIDFDAGRVFGAAEQDALSHEFMTFILDIASGRIKTKSEINEQREIAIWKTGVTL
jgi:altronate hydrolase